MTKNNMNIWNLPELELEKGKFEPNWQSLKQYNCPNWFRNFKFGFWSHTDPQSVPEDGDWYARSMYMQQDAVDSCNGQNNRYENHCKNYGHPSEFGYKDICNLWTCKEWDAEEYIKLGMRVGAKYFCALGNHHDNYDCWDSKYQPWNSVNVGPKKDVIGIWKKLCKKYNLPFGVTIHATPGRTWNEFMPQYYDCDKTGNKVGVPYDGNLTKEDGIGKWWEGLDPKDLYGPKHKATNKVEDIPKSFINQFMHRVDDVLKYDLDMLYFDDSVGYIEELGTIRGFGTQYLSPKIISHFYNKSMKMRNGNLDSVLFIKDIGGKWNSVFDENLEDVAKSVVNDFERIRSEEINPYPWQTETSFSDWHYRKGMEYLSSKQVIRELVDVVSKNGNYMISICQHGDGSVDKELIEIINRIGDWMNINGEAIYETRPYEYSQSGNNIFFTRKSDVVYAILTEWSENGNFEINHLGKKSSTCGNVKSISLLGSDACVNFIQTENNLIIKVNEQIVESDAYVIKIIQDKILVNDDDDGVEYEGWYHICNQESGDYNNDCHFSDIKGETCTFKFNGTGIEYITRVGNELGSVDIYIDEEFKKNVNLCGEEKTQQVVFSVSNMKDAEHTIKIRNASDKTICIDAFKVI